MRVAVLSDIHANREAMTAVLDQPEVRGADQLVILGDLVGFGPDPGWCVTRARELAAEGAICLMGLHEAAVVAPVAEGVMTPQARAVVDWTRDRLDPGQIAFLRDLPQDAWIGDALFTHAGAHPPDTWPYVTDPRSAASAFLATQARVTVCGHQHVALLFRDAGPERAEPVAATGTVPVPGPDRWLAVAGSVGQPRDGDTRAAALLLDLDAQAVSVLRVGYDTAVTAGKLRAAGLPESLAARLLIGL